MKTPIIDISAAPFEDYVRQYGKTEGILYGIWYRIARPAMVVMIWVFFSLYVYHSLITVGGTAAQIAELFMYVAVVASMAAALVSWMIVYNFYKWIRMRDREEADELFRTNTPVSMPAWPSPPGCQLLLVRHDDSGAIVSVEPWKQLLPEPSPVYVPDLFPVSSSISASRAA